MKQKHVLLDDRYLDLNKAKHEHYHHFTPISLDIFFSVFVDRPSVEIVREELQSPRLRLNQLQLSSPRRLSLKDHQQSPNVLSLQSQSSLLLESSPLQQRGLVRHG